MTIRNSVSTLRTIVRLVREQEISFLAGSIAFFAFVSLIPAMVLLLAVGTLLGGEQFATSLVELVEDSLSEEGQEILTAALADTTGIAGASAAGLVVLFWSTLKVFRALDIAFDRIYLAGSPPSLPRQILNGTIVILAVGTSLILLLLVRTALTWLPIAYAGLFGVALVFVGLVIVLTPMYYVMPPTSVSLRRTLPGTVTAVAGLLLLQELFQIYASQAGQYQAYGFIGAVLLFLLWLYFGATIILVGGVVNAALTLDSPHSSTHEESQSDSTTHDTRLNDGTRRSADGSGADVQTDGSPDE